MDRSNHYEAAFEAYLQWHGLCYVAVDESRRATLDDVPVKSLDFVVFGPFGAKLVVDIKGRRYPGGKDGKQRAVWECWATQEDVDSLERWAELWGPGYQGMLVFAYHLLPSVGVPAFTQDLWTWRGQRYLFRAVPSADYRVHMRVRSPSWRTVALPRAAFRNLVRPLHHFTHATPVAAEECPF